MITPEKVGWQCHYCHHFILCHDEHGCVTPDPLLGDRPCLCMAFADLPHLDVVRQAIAALPAPEVIGRRTVET